MGEQWARRAVGEPLEQQLAQLIWHTFSATLKAFLRQVCPPCCFICPAAGLYRHGLWLGGWDVWTSFLLLLRLITLGCGPKVNTDIKRKGPSSEKLKVNWIVWQTVANTIIASASTTTPLPTIRLENNSTPSCGAVRKQERDGRGAAQCG